jgi:hypothetical protein
MKYTYLGYWGDHFCVSPQTLHDMFWYQKRALQWDLSSNLSLIYMKPKLSFFQFLRMAHQFFNTICCTGSQMNFSSPRPSPDHGLSYCYMTVTKIYSLIPSSLANPNIQLWSIKTGSWNYRVSWPQYWTGKVTYNS